MRAEAERYTQVVNVYNGVGAGWAGEAGRLGPGAQAFGSVFRTCRWEDQLSL